MGKNYITDKYVLVLKYFRKKKKTLGQLEGFYSIIPPKEPMMIFLSK